MPRNPDVTHKIMASIPSKNTKPELILRKALWHENLRFRINYSKLPGRPDIVFTKQRIAVFCDGDFWHGHNWALRGLPSLERELDNYSDYWKQKILQNIARDKKVNEALKDMEWQVIRFWESDIKKDTPNCVQIVKAAISEINNK